MRLITYKTLKRKHDLIFGDTKYINMWQERLRLPSRLPMEEAISDFKQYTVGRIKERCEVHQS